MAPKGVLNSPYRINNTLKTPVDTFPLHIFLTSVLTLFYQPCLCVVSLNNVNNFSENSVSNAKLKYL
jgi:hypothetical protein